MDCDSSVGIKQELDSVRTKLQDAPTPALRHEEDSLTKVLWDHEISHNAGLTENCKRRGSH